MTCHMNLYNGAIYHPRDALCKCPLSFDVHFWLIVSLISSSKLYNMIPTRILRILNSHWLECGTPIGSAAVGHGPIFAFGLLSIRLIHDSEEWRSTILDPLPQFTCLAFPGFPWRSSGRSSMVVPSSSW
jgi:hypothetical protein